MELKFNVDGMKLTRENRPVIAADSMNYLTASFTFSEDWDGLEKIAKFRKGTAEYPFVLIDDEIPASANLSLSEGVWLVNVCGYEYEGETEILRIPSDMVELTVKPSMYGGGEELPTAPQTFAEQLFAAAFQSLFDLAVAGGYTGTFEEWMEYLLTTYVSGTFGTAAYKNTGTNEGDVPILGSGGKLASALMPSIAVGNDRGNVSTQADLVTVSDAESNDIVAVTADTDSSKNGIYMLFGSYDTLSNWKQLTPPGAVFSVNGQTGAVTIDLSGKADLVSGKVDPEQLSYNLHYGSIDKNVGAAYNRGLMRMNSTGDRTVTILTNAVEPLPIGYVLVVSRWNTGNVTFVASSGVTLRSAGGLTSISAQYKKATLTKIDTDEWYLTGDLS